MAFVCMLLTTPFARPSGINLMLFWMGFLAHVNSTRMCINSSHQTLLCKFSALTYLKDARKHYFFFFPSRSFIMFSVMIRSDTIIRAMWLNKKRSPQAQAAGSA